MLTLAYRSRCRAVTILLAFAAVTFAAQASAQSYPSNTIRVVVANAAGTPPDIISRVIATDLAESEGWKVIIENRPGAVQTLAGAEVLKQSADGYSIFALTVQGSAAPALLANMPFRLEADFAPVIKASTSYNVLVVNPSVPAKSVAELVSLLKSHRTSSTSPQAVLERLHI